MTYMLLSGCPPFDGHTNSHIISAVRAGKVYFEPELFGGVSALAREFILSLLQTDPSLRPTAAQALQHPWLVRMTQGADDATSRGVLGGVVRNLVKFRSFSAFKRIALEVVAFSLAPQQVSSRSLCSTCTLSCCCSCCLLFGVSEGEGWAHAPGTHAPGTRVRAVRAAP